MQTLLTFLVVLGVLVFVHELGHFLAARRIGVRVLTFSLGFGPKLVKVRRGDTEYCISAIPLGGYVKMAGESPEDARSGADDEFMSKTKWQRFQVLIMGPVMNLLLAVVVLAIVLAQGADIPAYLDEPAVIGRVEAGSPAAAAGMQAGDRIVAVAGDDIGTWADLELRVGLRRPGREMQVTFVRDGEQRTVPLTPVAEGRFEIGNIGVLPETPPVVQSVTAGWPADSAGVRPGDVLLTLNGERIATVSDLLPMVERNRDQEIALTLLRDGREMELRMRARIEPDGPRIGLSHGPRMKVVELTVLQALQESVKRNYENTGLIFRTLGGLFTGETSVRQLQGPVTIAVVSGEAAEAGTRSVLVLMAIISLNLGILNLLPIPVLDGGHILIMALEGVARRDFSMQAKEKMLLAGFVVLVMLMATVIYNDLTRISAVEALMPWRN